MTYKCVVKLYFKSLCSFLANKKTGGYSPIFLPDSRGLLFSLSCLGHQHLAPRVNILGPILTSYDIQARQRTTGHRSFQIISFSPPSLQAKKTSPHPIYMVSYTRLPIQDAACSEIVLLIRCICARDITVITRPIACIAITPTKRNHVTRSQ